MNGLLSLFARFTLFALAGVWLLSSTAQPLAQTQQTILTQINVEGSARFSDSQISAASGLKLGQPANDSVLVAAVDHLSKSGAFSEITYRYKTLAGKLMVTFIVIDEPKTMSCTFDNFVWFAPDEADRAVRAEVPLYDGRLPVDGDVVTAVVTALEHLLAQHHIAANVTYLPASKTLGSAPTELRFSAKGNLPPVSSVEFIGGPLEAEFFSVSKQRLTGHPFSAAYSRSIAEKDLDVIYQNHAYLRAHFNDPQVTFLPGSNDSDPGNVKLEFTVVPGPLYSWHGADWDGNMAYSSAELDRYLGMKDGDPAGLDKISTGMESVRGGYGQKGYIAASLTPMQSFDDSARQVHYSFQIKEGGQYHMGALTVSGLDDNTAERIRRAWRLKAGDIYDASYVKIFQTKDLMATLSGSSGVSRSGHFSVSTHPNQNTLTMDIGVSFSTD